MAKKIYVGNLPFSTSEDEVRELFEQFGTILTIKLVADRETGKFRGFGFIEMADEEADAAIDALNGTNVGGRIIRVNQARERGAQRSRRYY